MREQLMIRGIVDPHLPCIMHGWNAYANENTKGAVMPVHPLIEFDTAIQNLMYDVLTADREAAANMLEVIQVRLVEAQATFFKMYYGDAAG